MWQELVGLVLAAIAVAGAGSINAQGGAPAVRPEEPAIRELMANGMTRSATFRDLATRLDTSDVVVYVRFAPCVGKVAACLLWASESDGVRRLVIKLNRAGRSPNELTALLAHELQHANEVASAPEIKDLASFRKSFASRGSTNADGFETDQARDVGRRVSVELAVRGSAVLRSRSRDDRFIDLHAESHEESARSEVR